MGLRINEIGPCPGQYGVTGAVGFRWWWFIAGRLATWLFSPGRQRSGMTMGQQRARSRRRGGRSRLRLGCGHVPDLADRYTDTVRPTE